ncbi:MAG: 23S rRNA (pseudouridine(1915)-N(3))-methyltransferase RlmH [Bacteroidota bacterium]
MKIKLIYIGKTSKKFLIEGENEYFDRIKHYISLERIEIQDIKNQKSLSFDQIKKAEGDKISPLISKDDIVYLLDDKGKQFTSKGLSEFLQNQFLSSSKSLVFIIGGAFGFSDELYSRANGKISLSSLTFSHQMVRMIFLEQLYRALTILKGEKYHHE